MSEEEKYEDELHNTDNNENHVNIDSSDDSDVSDVSDVSNYKSYYEYRNRTYKSLIEQCKKYIKLTYVKTCKGSFYHISFTINDDDKKILYTFRCCSNYSYTSSYDIHTEIDYNYACSYCLYRLKDFIKKIIEHNIIDEDMYNNTLFRCNMLIKNKKKPKICSRFVDKPDSYCTQHTKSLENVFIDKTPFPKDIYNMIIDMV